MMLGIILCGGQSLRMGTDKGLLNHEDKLWAQVANSKLSSLGMPVKLSVNPLQLETYTNYFEKEKLIVDHPSLDIRGPLLGVLSAHLSNPEEDLFLLACDMLMMEVALLQKLIDAANASGFFDAYIFVKEGQQEPLCGIYKAEGLNKIMQLLKSGDFTRHSMKYALSNLKVNEIAVEQQDYPNFGNFNSHAEINGL